MAKQRYGVIPVAPKEERTDVDGTVHASKMERKRWLELRMLVSAEAVCVIARQPFFRLGPDFTYTADFLVSGDDDWHVEEIKGPTRDRDFQRTKRLWKKYGPCPLVVLTGIRGGWKREVIEPN